MTRVSRTAHMPAEPARVWEAVASPDRLSRWLGALVELDLRPGGEGTAREPGGLVRRLVVEEVRPGARLAFHWWPADRDGETPADSGASTVEIDLEPADGGTVVRVTETLSPQAARPPMAMAVGAT